MRGVTAAGVPLVAIGHNGRVAWGFTTGLSDEDDLYAESADRETYRFKGADAADGVPRRDASPTARRPPTCSSFPDEVVPGAGSKTERICRTVHGPVEVRAGGARYARRYAIWGREIETLEGLTELNERRGRSRDVDRALQRVTWNENIIAADIAGNIGYWHPGLHPLRPLRLRRAPALPGDRRGRVARAAAARRTPHVINPQQGWLATGTTCRRGAGRTGDAEAPSALAGPFHRRGVAELLVGASSRRRRRGGARRRSSRQRHDRAAAPARRPAAARARARRDAASAERARRAARVGRLVPPRRRATGPSTRASRSGSSSRTRPSGSRSIGSPARGRRAEGPRRRRPGSLARVRHRQRRGVRAADADGRAATARPPRRRSKKLAERFGTADVAKWREPRQHVRGQRPGRRGDAGELPVLRPRDLGAVRGPRARSVPSVAWVETASLSFVARHEREIAEGPRRCSRTWSASARSSSRGSSSVPGEVAVVMHPRPLMLNLAAPWLPLARLVSAPPAGATSPASSAAARSTCWRPPHWSGAPRPCRDRARCCCAPRGTSTRTSWSAPTTRPPTPLLAVHASARYVEMAWLCEGAATYFAGQVPHMRAAIARRLREGRRPRFPPTSRDAWVLGGTVFALLEQSGDPTHAWDLARTARRRGVTGGRSRRAFGRPRGGVERGWTDYLAGAHVRPEGARVGVEHLEQRRDHALVELGPGPGQQLGAGLALRHGGAVRAIAGHRVVGVAGEDDPRAQRDASPARPSG